MRCRYIVLALAAAIAGCGAGHPGTNRAGVQVESGNCESAGADGHTVSQSCEFVLSDGERFRCRSAFPGQTPTAGRLQRSSGCVRLRPLALSASERRLIAALDRARSCLIAHGRRAVGGPVLPPNRPTASMPDGEIVISSTHPSFIAFYTSTARARRLGVTLTRNARRLHGQLERHGAETILFTAAPPSKQLRSAVEACLPS